MRHPLRTTALLSLLAFVGGIAALVFSRHRRDAPA
jgi:hypothetical protein